MDNAWRSFMWEHIPYEEKHLDEMLAMTKQNYGDIEIADKEYILHQYFKNPAGKAAIELAYDFESQCLAGQYIAIPNRIVIDGTVYPILLSLNTLTNENYRGQGIFTKLAERLYTSNTPDFIGVYGMPNQNSYHGFIKKLNCRDFGSIPLFLRPLKPTNLVKERLHSSFLSSLARPFNLIYKTKPVRLPANLEIVEIDYNNLDLVDEFWESIHRKYPVMIVRDADYIKWRYLDTPIRNYRVYVLLKSGSPCAYAVGRITDVAGMNCGMLVDLLTLPGQEYDGRYLVNKMLTYFERKNVDMAGCLMKTGTGEAALLKKCGFFVCPKFLEPQPFPMILRIFRKDIEPMKISNFDDWFFTMGDYDAI